MELLAACGGDGAAVAVYGIVLQFPLFPKLKYFFLGLAHILMENGIVCEMYLACKQQQKGEECK